MSQDLILLNETLQKFSEINSNSSSLYRDALGILSLANKYTPDFEKLLSGNFSQSQSQMVSHSGISQILSQKSDSQKDSQEWLISQLENSISNIEQDVVQSQKLKSHSSPISIELIRHENKRSPTSSKNRKNAKYHFNEIPKVRVSNRLKRKAPEVLPSIESKITFEHSKRTKSQTFENDSGSENLYKVQEQGKVRNVSPQNDRFSPVIQIFDNNCNIVSKIEKSKTIVADSREKDDYKMRNAKAARKLREKRKSESAGKTLKLYELENDNLKHKEQIEALENKLELLRRWAVLEYSLPRGYDQEDLRDAILKREIKQE